MAGPIMHAQEGPASSGGSSARPSPPLYQRGASHHQHQYPGARAYMSSRDYVSSELDAVKDDFGPSIEDCINMGSFAEEDSPPRHRRRQGNSPPYGPGF
jgi:hypothetical protein